MAGKEPLSHLDCRLYFSQFGLISLTDFIPFSSYLSLLSVSSTTFPLGRNTCGVLAHLFFSHLLLLSTFYHLIPSGFFFFSSSTQRETSSRNNFPVLLYSLWLSPMWYLMSSFLLIHTTCGMCFPQPSAHHCTWQHIFAAINWLNWAFAAQTNNDGISCGIFRISFGFLGFW